MRKSELLTVARAKGLTINTVNILLMTKIFIFILFIVYFYRYLSIFLPFMSI